MNDTSMKPIIKVIRDQLKMTQNDFAKLLGVGERTVRRWEKNDQNVPESVLKLAKLAVKNRTVLGLKNLDRS